MSRGISTSKRRVTCFSLAILSILCSATKIAKAEPESHVQPNNELPSYEKLSKIVFDNGRKEPALPRSSELVFSLRGELQFRIQAMSKLALEPTATDLAANPGIREKNLDQTEFATAWLRLSPKLDLGTKLSVIGQIDVGQGLYFGSEAHGVSSDPMPRDYSQPALAYLRPRALYAEFREKFGVLRFGLQPNHWGMGILANDGNHATLFGDYRLGQISERLLFATKPFGIRSPFTLAVAGDLVYQDNLARASRGDVAVQGVVAAFVEKGPHQLGFFGVARSQHNNRTAFESASYTDKLNVFALDLAGHTALPVAGTDHFFWAEAESALLLGNTNLLRNGNDAKYNATTRIEAFGFASKFGVTFVEKGLAEKTEPAIFAVQNKKSPSKAGNATDKFGYATASVEIGYASGDSNPYDSVERKFSFDPNHKIGLLLFDEILRWQTARTANAAKDPLLTAKPAAGIPLLPSGGAIFGAVYLNPTFLYRPKPFIDLKFGMVMAQATSDIVSPYRLVVAGKNENYNRGPSTDRDLGVELDAGFEVRKKLNDDLLLQVGAQGALLVPGLALASDSGFLPNKPWLMQVRAGAQF